MLIPFQFCVQEKPNVFAGFGGFGVRSAPASNAFGSISFLPQSTTAPAAAEKENGKPVSKTDEEETDKNDKEWQYQNSLKVLNETVSSWISDHVRKNPYCILTPVFQDYEKHLKEIEANRKLEKEAIKSESEPSQPTKFQFNAKPPAAQPAEIPAAKPAFSFSSSTAPSSSTAAAAPISTFSFKPSTDNPPPAPFSFASLNKPSTTTSSSDAPASTPFSFGLSKPSFGNSASTATFSFGLSKY